MLSCRDDISPDKQKCGSSKSLGQSSGLHACSLNINFANLLQAFKAMTRINDTLPLLLLVYVLKLIQGIPMLADSWQFCNHKTQWSLGLVTELD